MREDRPMPRVLVGMLLGTLVAGCGDKECLRLPCLFLPAVALTVTDAVDGGPVANPIANGLPCGTLGACVPTRADGGMLGAGTSSIDVTAAGYAHVVLEVTVPSATPDPCSCEPEYVPQLRDVALPPL